MKIYMSNWYQKEFKYMQIKINNQMLDQALKSYSDYVDVSLLRHFYSICDISHWT